MADKMEKETIEMRVHHLDMLRCYMKSADKRDFIKKNLLIAKYDEGVIEEELDEFVSNVYDFYESILKGDRNIRLVSEPDGVCNGKCTFRRTGGCDLNTAKETDIQKSGIEHYNVEIGKEYSLNEILKIMEDYISLRVDMYTRAVHGW